MMKLKVKCSVPEGEIIYLKINNEVKELYSFESFTTFNLNDKKEYILEVERRPDKSNRSLINLLIFIVTIFIQGLFNALLINDNRDWFNEIIPYGMKANIIINVNQIIENTNVGKITSVKYIKNIADLKNQYFNFVKRFLSVYALVLALLNFLLIIAIKNNILYAAIFIIFIMVLLLIVLIFALIKQYRKLNILNTFYNL